MNRCHLEAPNLVPVQDLRVGEKGVQKRQQYLKSVHTFVPNLLVSLDAPTTAKEGEAKKVRSISRTDLVEVDISRMAVL